MDWLVGRRMDGWMDWLFVAVSIILSLRVCNQMAAKCHSLVRYAGLMKNRQLKYVAESEFHLKAEKDVTVRLQLVASYSPFTSARPCNAP